MKDPILDDLVESKTLTSYEYVNVDDDGKVGHTSKFRNTERLTLTFPNGEVIVIGTCCSGSAEDTILTFSQRID